MSQAPALEPAFAPAPHGSLRVAAAQLENVVGDISGNRDRIIEAMAWAQEQDADVLVLPELVLTGYPLEDLALRQEFADAALRALEQIAAAAGRCATVVGCLDRVVPRRSTDTRLRSTTIAAAVCCDGELRGLYHKVLLPNYDLFNEARNFAAGDDPARVWRIGEAVVGISICEDMWSGDGPPERQAAAGAQIMLAPNASPFHFQKGRGRFDLVSKVARRNGIPVVYVNSVGGQDALVFDGGSIVVDAAGTVLYQAEQFVPTRFCLDVPLGAPRRRADPAAPTVVHTRPTARTGASRRPASPPALEDNEQVWGALVLGTRDFARRNGHERIVLGLSGGIDSAVCAAVAADAVGAENVLGVAIPGRETDPREALLARRIAESLGIGFAEVHVDGAAGQIEQGLEALIGAEVTRETHESLVARARGALLMGVADERGALVLATGNKSELSIGTGVLGGDMAGLFAPLIDCPKTLLYELARLRNMRGAVIPEDVLAAGPTALDNERAELPPYAELDQVVYRYVVLGEGVEEMVADGLSRDRVRGVLQLVDDAEYKRRLMPPGVKITAGAFAKDRQMPIVNAWRPYRREEEAIVGGDPAPAVGNADQPAVAPEDDPAVPG